VIEPPPELLNWAVRVMPEPSVVVPPTDDELLPNCEVNVSKIFEAFVVLVLGLVSLSLAEAVRLLNSVNPFTETVLTSILRPRRE